MAASKKAPLALRADFPAGSLHGQDFADAMRAEPLRDVRVRGCGWPEEHCDFCAEVASWPLDADGLVILPEAIRG